MAMCSRNHRTVNNKERRTYGPTFHQHQELPAHYGSLFGVLHKVHHSTSKYSVEFSYPGTIS